jgi:aryl-alcohol dehydrogenase-like predicted oxidoreductase
MRHSRREFLRTASAAALAASAAAGQTTQTTEMGAPPLDPTKALNYNPKMGYRRLGKTEHLISEVSLGGHGGSAVEDRVRVLEKAVALGINYVDNNIDAECDLYGEAMASSDTAKRDKWFIGFASWPEKITTEYEDQLTPEGMMRNIEARLRSYHTEMLDMWRPVGATWGEGQTSMATMLMVSDRTLDMVVEVFGKAKEQGKVRFLGVSAHNPKVFRRVLEAYPQFSVIIFPYLFLTEEFGGDSLLAVAKEKNVGVIGLKPFGAGTIFAQRPSQIQGRVDESARVLVREMLREPRISAVIPGVNVPEQLEENVRGSYERDVATTPEDLAILSEYADRFFANLTPEYRWLHEWRRV